MPSALTVTFVQATILNAISNVLAQLIDQRNNKVRQQTPSKTTKLTTTGPFRSQFACVGAISHLWHHDSAA